MIARYGISKIIMVPYKSVGDCTQHNQLRCIHIASYPGPPFNFARGGPGVQKYVI